MNVAQYYEELRRVEASLPEAYVWITSLATRNGGVAGRTMEVSRRTAASMIVMGTARVAEATEVEAARRRDEADVRRAELLPPSEFIVGGGDK